MYVHVVYTGQFPSLPFSTNIPFSVGCHTASRPKKGGRGGFAYEFRISISPAQPNPPFPFYCHRWKKGGEGELLLSGLPSSLSSCANVTLLLLLRNHRFGPISIGDKILNSKFAYFTFAVNMYSRFNLDILQDRYRICKKIPLLPPLPMYFLDLFNAMSA